MTKNTPSQPRLTHDQYLALRADIAAADFVMARKFAALEEKYNFNPRQPRVPRGSPDGGQWTNGVGGGVAAPNRTPRAYVGARFQQAKFPEDAIPPRLAGVLVGTSARVQRFLIENENSVTRFVGLLQAAGGATEIVGGVALAGGGVATSEVGVGIAVAGVGAWAVKNGFDNFRTGVNTLMSGTPQETDLHRTFRGLGLTEAEADIAELGLSGLGAAGAAKLAKPAFDTAVRAGLARSTAEIWASTPLDIRIGGRSMWLEKNIETRGNAWASFDVKRNPGFRETPPGFPTFDQVNLDNTVAISNKTMDLVVYSYSRTDKHAMFNTTKRYIDQVANFKYAKRVNDVVSITTLKESRLHLLLPAGEATPAQAAQLAAARAYAEAREVFLTIEYAR